MDAFEASALIRAPAARVWAILMDAPHYPSWDSGVTKVEGRIADGERITVHSEVSPDRAFPVRVSMEPPNTMRWTGGLPLGLFRGVRTFRIEPEGEEDCCWGSCPARSPTSVRPSRASSMG